MYPSETAWFIKEYEEAVGRPYGYLFVDLRPTTPDRCRLRTDVLPGEERFDKGFEENKNFPRTAPVPQTTNSDGAHDNFGDATHSE